MGGKSRVHEATIATGDEDERDDDILDGDGTEDDPFLESWREDGTKVHNQYLFIMNTVLCYEHTIFICVVPRRNGLKQRPGC